MSTLGPKTPKPDSIDSSYKLYGSVATEGMGAYIQLFRRGGMYHGDVAFFEGNRTLAELKQLQEIIDRAVLILELHEKQEAPPPIPTRFERT